MYVTKRDAMRFGESVEVHVERRMLFPIEVRNVSVPGHAAVSICLREPDGGEFIIFLDFDQAQELINGLIRALPKEEEKVERE